MKGCGQFERVAAVMEAKINHHSPGAVSGSLARWAARRCSYINSDPPRATAVRVRAATNAHQLER